MKTPITLLTLTLAGLLLAPGLQAQDAKPGEKAGDRPRGGGGAGGGRQDPAERLKMMKENLNLTDEQTEKVKAIFEKNREKYKEVRENTGLSQEDRRAKMTELRTAETEEMKTILTPEQQEKAKKMREERAKQNAGK